MDLFVVIKRSITLFLLCIYFFITYTSDTKQVTEIQSSNLEIRNHVMYPKKTAKKEQITKYQKPENTVIVNISDRKYISEAQLKDNRLISKFACSKKFLGEAQCRTLNVFEETKLPSVCKSSNKRYGFYTCISGGKVHYNNSKVLVNGIQAIGKHVSDSIGKSKRKLVDNQSNTWSEYGKSIVRDVLLGTLQLEIDSIGKFDGTVNFQWLGNTSLGYYIGENGRIDLEVMTSKVNIENNSTSVFDRSASIFAFLFNLYYNPSIKNTRFTPYVSLGIGPTIFRLKKFIESSPGHVIPLNVPWFAYQAKLGIDYSIIPEMSIFLGYRYFNIPIPVADNIVTHNIEIGLRLNF